MDGDELKEIILDNVKDLVTSFTHYDRKEDEELTEAVLDGAISDGVVTLDEIIEAFATELKEVYV